MECDSANHTGKRMFYLRDKKTLGKENCLSEKRNKLGQLIDIRGINMEEVASQKWPDLDQ